MVIEASQRTVTTEIFALHMAGGLLQMKYSHWMLTLSLKVFVLLVQHHEIIDSARSENIRIPRSGLRAAIEDADVILRLKGTAKNLYRRELGNAQRSHCAWTDGDNDFGDSSRHAPQGSAPTGACLQLDRLLCGRLCRWRAEPRRHI